MFVPAVLRKMLGPAMEEVVGYSSKVHNVEQLTKFCSDDQMKEDSIGVACMGEKKNAYKSYGGET